MVSGVVYFRILMKSPMVSPPLCFFGMSAISSFSVSTRVILRSFSSFRARVIGGVKVPFSIL